MPDLIPKPYQERGVNDLVDAIAAGAKRIILVSPTGGGKSFMMAMAIRRLFDLGMRLQLYTNRKMLIDQTSKKMTEYKIDHGIRAAGHEFQPYYPIQLSSVQTEYSRVLKTDGPTGWNLFDANVVFIDEGHLANNEQTQSLINKHLEAGAAVVYVTATPLDMEGLAEKMIIAGTNSELRKCGMLAPAWHFGAPEPDFKAWKVEAEDELTEPMVKKLLDVKKVFGNIVEWYDRTNPDKRPTILFAPGVEESRWLAKHLTDTGIPSAHIDGSDVWVDGKFSRSNEKVRDAILERSREGTIKIITNRFVLREGVDAPWIGHAIFATVFGSLQTYLQSGGRILRAHPDLPYVTIQDHGGNWHKWGSLNADRAWELDLSSRAMIGARANALREKEDQEPARCSKCGMIIAGRKCPTCKFEIPEERRMRPVLQSDGTVVEHFGDIFIQRARRMDYTTTEKWNNCYFRGRSTKWTVDGELMSCRAIYKLIGEDGPPEDGTIHDAIRVLREKGHVVENVKIGLTFAQAEALFFKEHYYWPPRNLGLMPAHGYDWYRRVADVPWCRLNSAVHQDA